jgi:hypothetical protein
VTPTVLPRWVSWPSWLQAPVRIMLIRLLDAYYSPWIKASRISFAQERVFRGTPFMGPLTCGDGLFTLIGTGWVHRARCVSARCSGLRH